MNKFGAVVMSFSWIFMIIVGSFFVIFGYSVVSTYQENEFAKSQLEFRLSLQSIFKKVGYGKGSETTSLEKVQYIFEDSKIELLCSEGFPLLSIDGEIDSSNNYLKNYPFFMTVIEQDRVDETYIAVEELDLPFYISPLMALVSQRNVYVFDREIWENYFEEKFSQTSAFKTLNTRVVDYSDPSTFDALFADVSKLELSSITFITTPERYAYIPKPSSMDSVVDIHLSISFNSQTHRAGRSSYEYTSGEITYMNTSYWTSNMSEEYTFNYTDYKDSLTLPTFALFSTPETYECGATTIDSLMTSTYNYYISKAELLVQQVSQSGIDTSNFCSENINQEEVILRYQNLLDNLISMRDYEDRFKNIENLNNLLEELWVSKDALDTYNCIDVY